MPDVRFEKWFSLTEAAEYLGIGTKSLTARCRAREITFCRLGHKGRNRQGQFRFRVRWLEEFLERHTVAAIPPRVQKRPIHRPIPTKIFIDPRDCGNPFE